MMNVRVEIRVEGKVESIYEGPETIAATLIRNVAVKFCSVHPFQIICMDYTPPKK